MTLPVAVVFDFDGVIANSEPLHLKALQETLAGAGVALTAQDYYARYLGYDDDGAFRAVLGDRGLPIEDQQVRALVADKARRLPALLSAPDVLMPGATACVQRLSAARPLAIASGALRQEIELVLGARDLRSAFGVIVAAGETPRSKPHPDPYERALALLRDAGLVSPGTPPGHCVAVEDSVWGLMSARCAGLRCIAITSSYPREELADADHVIDSLDELTLELLSAVAGTA